MSIVQELNTFVYKCIDIDIYIYIYTDAICVHIDVLPTNYL